MMGASGRVFMAGPRDALRRARAAIRAVLAEDRGPRASPDRRGPRLNARFDDPLRFAGERAGTLTLDASAAECG